MATTQSDTLRFGGDHPAQQEFVESDARYAAYIAGIGSGKTVGGIGRLIRNVVNLNPGYTGYVLAPTVPSLRNVIIPELDKWGILGRAEYNRTEKKLEFPNGSTVIFESADNDRKIERLRGPSIGWFWMDEAATISERAWDIMVGRLRDGDHLNAYVTTTPKGENWIHDKFVNPDSRLEDADVVRGVPSTENPHLPDAYEDIVGEYEGRFYEQEVLGEFVGFEGLVYPWFDDDNIVDSAPDHYDEVVYGVDWGHNNPAVIVAVVRTGDEWTVAGEWYERRCTVQDHSRALGDLVDRFGSGPVYCDPAEPANIEQFRRDGFNAREADNSVTPGIQHVSSLSDQLRVARHCQNIRNEFSQYQYKEGGDGDRPLKQHDHACVVGTTDVATPGGSVEIRNLSVGDRVLTRAGAKTVAVAEQTASDAKVYELTLSDGTSLLATANHPIYTPHDGFKQLDTLRYGEPVSTLGSYMGICQKLTKSNTKASHSGGIQSRTTVPTAVTTVQAETKSKMEQGHSTAKCGKTRTASMKYQTATTSTTRTATRQTTHRKILNASRRKNTPNDTRNSGSVPKTSKGGLKPPKSGTGATRAASGIRNTGTTRSGSYSMSQKPKTATSVATTLSTTPTLGSAQTPVSQSGDGNQAKTTKPDSAKLAESHSRPTSTATKSPVRVVALEPLSRGRPVYNLTVEGEHEYFANGVLTHNCDALRYCLFTHDRRVSGSSQESDSSGIAFR